MAGLELDNALGHWALIDVNCHLERRLQCNRVFGIWFHSPFTSVPAFQRIEFTIMKPKGIAVHKICLEGISSCQYSVE